MEQALLIAESYHGNAAVDLFKIRLAECGYEGGEMGESVSFDYIYRLEAGLVQRARSGWIYPLLVGQPGPTGEREGPR